MKLSKKSEEGGYFVKRSGRSREVHEVDIYQLIELRLAEARLS